MTDEQIDALLALHRSDIRRIAQVLASIQDLVDTFNMCFAGEDSAVQRRAAIRLRPVFIPLMLELTLLLPPFVQRAFRFSEMDMDSCLELSVRVMQYVRDVTDEAVALFE